MAGWRGSSKNPAFFYRCTKESNVDPAEVSKNGRILLPNPQVQKLVCADRKFKALFAPPRRPRLPRHPSPPAPPPQHAAAACSQTEHGAARLTLVLARRCRMGEGMALQGALGRRPRKGRIGSLAL